MRLTLERHKYAPELNRIHFPNGASRPAPGITSIRQYRAANAPARPMIRAVVTKTYSSASCGWLDSRTVGMVETRGHALVYARMLRTRCLPGEHVLVFCRTRLVWA